MCEKPCDLFSAWSHSCDVGCSRGSREPRFMMEAPQLFPPDIPVFLFVSLI